MRSGAVAQPWLSTKPPPGGPLDRAHPLAGGLVAAYPLSEAAGRLVWDATGRHGPGTIAGATTWQSGSYGAALNFAATGTQCILSGTSAFLSNNPEISVAALVYFSALPGTESSIYSEDHATAGTQLHLRVTSANKFGMSVLQSSVVWVDVIDTTALATGAWHLVAGTASTAAGLVALYVDGAQKATLPWDGTYKSGATVSNLGRYINSSAFYLHGLCAQLLLWTRVLAPDEITQLALNPLALYAPARRLWVMPRTQGPTLAAATLSPAGSITRTPAHRAAGGSTPAGAIVRTPAHASAGSSTCTGTLTRTSAHALAAASTLAGGLVRTLARGAAGSMTPAGTLARLAACARAGASTLAGALGRTPAHREAGSSTPSGTIARTPAHGQTGSSTPAGDLGRTPLVALSGALSAGAGTLARTITGTGAAALAASGTLQQAISTAYDTALAATGALARTCSTPVATATLTATGALGRVAALARGATLDLVGTLGRLHTLGLGATVALVGALAKGPRRQQAGTLAPDGALARTAALVRAGTVPLRGRYVGIFRVVRRAALALVARLALLLAPPRAGGQSAALVLPTRTHALDRTEAPRPVALLAPARARTLTLSPHRTVPMQLVPSDDDPDAPLVIAPLERNIAFVADFSADIPSGRQIASVSTQVVRLDDPTATDLSDDFVATTTRTNSNQSIEVIVGNGAQQERATYRVRIIATLDNSPATDLVGYFDLPCRE